MRVLHLIPGLGGSGGAERSLAHLAPGLVAAGVELHVVVMSDRRGLVDELEDCGVTVRDLPVVGRGPLVVRRARAVRRLVRELRPDLVHATLVDADLPAQLALPAGRPPLVVTWAGTTFDGARRSEPGIRWRSLQALRIVEAVLGRWSRAWYQAVTPGVATANARALWSNPDRIRVAERGRPPALPADPVRRRATRAALGLGDDDRLVLAVGRHEPQKAHRRLVAAAELLDPSPADGPDDGRAGRTLVVIAGRTGLSTAALEAAASDRVVLLGPRSDVPELLEAADVFVSSSTHEGAAGAVIEAMAAGVPIVSSSVRGLDGVLVDGDNALVVDDADDPAAFAAAIRRALDDAPLRGRLASGAAETYERRFTIERSTRSLLALYREAVGATPARSKS